jgi:hypothetical protein
LIFIKFFPYKAAKPLDKHLKLLEKKPLPLFIKSGTLIAYFNMDQHPFNRGICQYTSLKNWAAEIGSK